MGMIVPNVFQIPCLERTSRKHLVASLGILLLYDDSYLGWSPKVNLHTWEGKYGDLLMRQNIIPWRSLFYGDAIRGGKEALQFYNCSCLSTSKIWEGRTIIFLN